mmetsp:Transcript_1611/g.3497  ORF Transcript_1611/g.3497 Transcript_1611/m.3497 type:complete len:341 (-) Transcript_1611:136-1158(-)|eukprot:CAMPEP_0178418104 /NCGR_PEP_ID=MMETSP0689_2-20121128/24916_1 /TAXON_ID=160604 /ORGANISM="Amphidinium massartii, Strain CS-259" /LENGTH=340 /DNA_ID=CAMNT_0020039487 /DNA_START=88 /DNA_END=1110 /DNA_ORIENTATION=+
MTLELEAQPSFTIVVKNTFLEVVEEKPKTRRSGVRRRSSGDISQVSPADGCDISDTTSFTGCLTDGDDSLSFDDFSMVATWSLRSDASQQPQLQQKEEQERAGQHSSPAAGFCSAPCWTQSQQQGSMASPVQAASVLPAVPQQVAPPPPMHTAFCLPPQACAVPSARASLSLQPLMEETRTTVMVRNLPINMNRSAFMMLLDYEGFHACYDFAYMPADFSSGVGLGYGFVNFLTPAHATRCFRHFDGFVLPTVWGGANVASVCCSWSDPHQGLQEHVERYRSSPVMHASVPDEWKPIILSNGCRVPFPRPVKHIKAPKKNKLRGPKRAAAVQAAAAAARQ